MSMIIKILDCIVVLVFLGSIWIEQYRVQLIATGILLLIVDFMISDSESRRTKKQAVQDEIITKSEPWE